MSMRRPNPSHQWLRGSSGEEWRRLLLSFSHCGAPISAPMKFEVLEFASNGEALKPLFSVSEAFDPVQNLHFPIKLLITRKSCFPGIKDLNWNRGVFYCGSV